MGSLGLKPKIGLALDIGLGREVCGFHNWRGKFEAYWLSDARI